MGIQNGFNRRKISSHSKARLKIVIFAFGSRFKNETFNLSTTQGKSFEFICFYKDQRNSTAPKLMTKKKKNC